MGEIPAKHQLKSKVSDFEIADYLQDEEMIQEYLNVVLEEGNAQEIIVALGHIARAKGMSKVAEQTGLSRPSLYKALSENTSPQFDTILKVLRAVGGNLQFKGNS
jgi:probable addiction module antidote protein